jgi:hypothetical protein
LGLGVPAETLLDKVSMEHYSENRSSGAICIQMPASNKDITLNHLTDFKGDRFIGL